MATTSLLPLAVAPVHGARVAVLMSRGGQQPFNFCRPHESRGHRRGSAGDIRRLAGDGSWGLSASSSTDSRHTPGASWAMRAPARCPPGAVPRSIDDAELGLGDRRRPPVLQCRLRASSSHWPGPTVVNGVGTPNAWPRLRRQCAIRRELIPSLTSRRTAAFPLHLRRSRPSESQTGSPSRCPDRNQGPAAAGVRWRRRCARRRGYRMNR